ncbi:hypothetical protein PLICBS_002122 [Purpureocillium lilacinum]|uniref:uncharacterized protein n=1 Tax=Purpureocillium lilacinum TaxID=33203 RepID=UPI002089F90C|nr:hypothetical protein PLICBS_002122 [Purpureocillium lilacinum]
MEPATDIINIEKNEGIGYQDELRLLLTGFSSFRHLIYSIVKLPKEADPLLRVVINECSFPHGMRAFMGLLLLTDRKHDPVLNAEAFIHMWYSSRVSRAIWEHITDVVGPNIEAVVRGIERRNRMEGYSDNEQLYHYRLLDPLIPRGGFVMLAIFTQAQWWEIRKRLKEPGTLPADKATIIRFLDVRKHSNSSAVYKARMTSARLMTLKKWQYDGCLLPYGHPRDEFDTVNPLFLHEHDTFPPGATQEPMGEWPMEFLDNADSPATGDVYGKLFYYLRDLLVQCQLRLKTLVVDVDLMTSLPKPFVGIGDVWDFHPLLSLTAFSRVLAHQDENPAAALLVHTGSTVYHSDPSVAKDLAKETELMSRETKTVLDVYAPLRPADVSQHDPQYIRRELGLVMWRNWDRFAAKYFSSPARWALRSLMPLGNPIREHQSVFQAGFLGLRARDKHKVVSRWPLRLVHSSNARPSLLEFNRYMSWGIDATGLTLRWIEWTLSGQDLPENDWYTWMHFALERSPEQYTRELEETVRGLKAAGGGSGEDVTNRRVEEGMGNLNLGTRAKGATENSSHTVDFADDVGSDEEQTTVAGKTASAGGRRAPGRVSTSDKGSHTVDVDEVSEEEENQPKKKSKKKKKKKSKG